MEPIAKFGQSIFRRLNWVPVETSPTEAPRAAAAIKYFHFSFLFATFRHLRLMSTSWSKPSPLTTFAGQNRIKFIPIGCSLQWRHSKKRTILKRNRTAMRLQISPNLHERLTRQNTWLRYLSLFFLLKRWHEVINYYFFTFKYSTDSHCIHRYWYIKPPKTVYWYLCGSTVTVHVLDTCTFDTKVPPQFCGVPIIIRFPPRRAFFSLAVVFERSARQKFASVIGFPENSQTK